MNCEPRAKSKAALLFLGAISLPWLIGCGSGSSGASTSTPVNNSVVLTADLGPDIANGGIVNGLFTTVTVCQHGTTTCVSISNVEVDTGSVGLRLLPTVIGSLTLTPISVSGSPLEECIQYGDTSYSWGPMELADVQIGGERALNIPVQVLGKESAPAPSASSPASNGAYCLTNTPDPNLPGTPPGNEDTLAALGANGILGIGSFVFDCGSSCTSLSFTKGYPYYICPGGTCQGVGVPTAEQAVNPIAVFSSGDNNGVMITLPGVPATGSGPVTGTMTFGIGTRANNALGTAQILALDQCGDLPSVTFHNVTYSDTSCTQSGSTALGGFLDTGSNALYVSDASTLASEGIPISDCAKGTAGFNFYCVSSGTTTLSNINLLGYLGVGSATISLNINDATTLFKTNNAVFNDLGSDSGTSISTDFFDLGMPFFLGRTVFVGIEGQSTPVGISAPNGFVAF